MGDVSRHRSLGSGWVQNRKVIGEKTMKHFTTEEWIDLANQVVSGSKKHAMTEHLEGCKRCKQTASLWQGVRSTAESVRKYKAPEATVRVAKTAFAAANLGRRRSRSATPAELLFDSFL